MKKVKVSCTRIVGDKVEQSELEGIEEPILVKKPEKSNISPFKLRGKKRG